VEQVCFGLFMLMLKFIWISTFILIYTYAFFCSVHPSKDWVWSQIPEIVRCGVDGLGGDGNDIDDMDAEAFMQAYVNIVAGACLSLGKCSLVFSLLL
jgi:anaphase-promoting complex subunit 1